MAILQAVWFHSLSRDRSSQKAIALNFKMLNRAIKNWADDELSLKILRGFFVRLGRHQSSRL